METMDDNKMTTIFTVALSTCNQHCNATNVQWDLSNQNTLK